MCFVAAAAAAAKAANAQPLSRQPLSMNLMMLVKKPLSKS
jgi:hypothetical protein